MAFERITLHVTDRCQLNCDHCLRDPAQKSTDMSLEVAQTAISESRAVMKTEIASFTGGEPTLHPKFPEFVAIAVAEGMKWAMVTNGIRLRKVLDSLGDNASECDAIYISMDGATPETHDLIRGAGSHDAVVEAVAVARERKIPVWIQLTLNRRNIDDVEGFCVQAARMGVTGLRFEGTQATGTLLDPALFVSAERMLEVRDEIEQLATRLKLQVPIAPGVPSRQRFVMCEAFEAAALYVEPDGQVRFCAKHAGVPSPPDAEDHIGKIGEVSLLQAQIRMFGVIRLAQNRRLELLKSGELSGWDAPQCNTCLAAFGRPFWTDAGKASGAQAKRERWRGAWVPSAEKAAEAEAALEATEAARA